MSAAALLLAAALSLTACQASDKGSESPEESPSASSPSETTPGGSSGPSEAEVTASAILDHLLTPDSQTLEAMSLAVEKGMGRPVEDRNSPPPNEGRAQT